MNAVFKTPVEVAIQASKNKKQFYSSGVYSDPNCGYSKNGVLIVGYGYDKDVDMKYWIVKNSWGDTWGENGYVNKIT